MKLSTSVLKVLLAFIIKLIVHISHQLLQYFPLARINKHLHLKEERGERSKSLLSVLFTINDSFK